MNKPARTSGLAFSDCVATSASASASACRMEGKQSRGLHVGRRCAAGQRVSGGEAEGKDRIVRSRLTLICGYAYAVLAYVLLHSGGGGRRGGSLPPTAGPVSISRKFLYS